MSGPINIVFNKDESLIDTIDVIYVLHGPKVAVSALNLYSKQKYDNLLKIRPQYIKHSLKIYKDLYKEDPLDYTKEQLVSKSSLIGMSSFRLLARIASIKFGVSLVKDMYNNRVRVINAAPPSYKGCFSYEDINTVLAACVSCK